MAGPKRPVTFGLLGAIELSSQTPSVGPIENPERQATSSMFQELWHERPPGAFLSWPILMAVAAEQETMSKAEVRWPFGRLEWSKGGRSIGEGGSDSSSCQWEPGKASHGNSSS